MKKKALLVGINKYPGCPLNGCLNDIMLDLKVIVEQFGYTDPLNRRVLTDESATTANILDRLNWLVSDIQAGDELFFKYSGHGAQVPCTDYENEIEPDGLDEIICPIDLDWRDKIIKDKDLHKIFDTLPEGVKLTVILDSCHSADMLKELVNPILQPVASPNRVRCMPTPPDIMARAFGMNLKTKKMLAVPNYEDQKGILVSGCRTDQTSADAWIQTTRRYHGALTWYANLVLSEANYKITYQDLVAATNKKLVEAGYDQQPQLDCADRFKTELYLGGKV
ncbi:MAG: caspase family protein [Lentisphaerota bacterium]